jgi:predicted nucleic acid-binding protein
VILVVDASVAVKWFVREDGHAAAVGLLASDFGIATVDLMFAEFANVLWKKLSRGEITLPQAKDACDSVPGYFANVLGTAPLLADAVELAQQIDHPVYDCLYVACAKQHNAKLVSVDARLLRKLADVNLSDVALSLDGACRLASNQNESTGSSSPRLEPPEG